MSHLQTSLVRAVGAAAALMILPLSTSPAFAARLTLEDSRHDMWFIEEGSTEPEPAPGAVIGDFVRTTFRHADRRVVIKSKFVELKRTGKRFTMWVDMRDENGAETTVGVRTSRSNRGGRTLLFNTQGDVPCDVLHRINYARNVVWIGMPRSCLDAPRWLRFRQLSEYSGQSLSFAFLDDPTTAGAPRVAWTARVRRG